MKNLTIFLIFLFFIVSCNRIKQYPEYSGIYPHLAYYNGGGECGTGAVVPWADRLWIVTYSPHCPFGSDDKLYEISEDLNLVIRPESIGGTPANRMIHKESGQLFIGPYVIDGNKNVRVLPWESVPGRYTGLARHLFDPNNRILLATMESGFYDIDVHTLQAKELYADGNVLMKQGLTKQFSTFLPGYHGKGFYSGQKVAVYSNNGEEGPLAQKKYDIPSGSLNEWDGKDWKLIRRNQFTEVTGPGDIGGNKSIDDPIWALGWDYKSIILAVREIDKGWSFFRLPKASFSYDGAHGWNTEWPRIRRIGDEYLMTMHGMFWHFPETFSSSNSSGIYPRGAYLKVIGDFCKWNNHLVFGCDDAAKSAFLNSRNKFNTNSGQSNSNLWFTSLDKPDNVGPTNASGSIWLNDTISANSPSDPFLFSGWKYRNAWVANRTKTKVSIEFQVDRKADNNWDTIKEIILQPHSSTCVSFDENESGVWIRAVSDKPLVADLTFSYGQKDLRTCIADRMFDGLSHVSNTTDDEILLYGLPDNKRTLAVLNDKNGKFYELDSAMNLVEKKDTFYSKYVHENLSLCSDTIMFEGNSVLVTDQRGRRWRLPYTNKQYLDRKLRISREVVTERTLLSISGSFYELPAENADGYAKVRPISTSDFAITDYTSYRGLLVLSGVIPTNNHNSHIITSDDGEIALWVGVVDDLWKLGKPVGTGGPWCRSSVEPNIPSDPFLIGFYDKRKLKINQTSNGDAVFTLEVDPSGDGHWFKYISIDVADGETATYNFPDDFQARWIRITSNRAVTATATFYYE